MVSLKHLLSGLTDLTAFAAPSRMADHREEETRIPTVEEAMAATKQALIHDGRRLKRDWLRVLERHAGPRRAN